MTRRTTRMGAPSREPRVRGRAPIFEHGQHSIASLMSQIERDEIALPDLQRPFVWEDTKVRDLLDSFFKGRKRAVLGNEIRGTAEPEPIDNRLFVLVLQHPQEKREVLATAAATCGALRR